MDRTNIDYNDKRFCDNHLLRELKWILGSVDSYKVRARNFYFDVLFSIYKCPACGGQLRMTEENNCSCPCGIVFDPTLAFQKSACCAAGLVRKTFHYVCLTCRKTVPSRFLFDERVFDKVYFREMMRESRERIKKKREEIRRLLAKSRSDPLPLLETPNLGAIPGLIHDLDAFIQNSSYDSNQCSFETETEYDMDKYRDHILSILRWDSMLFSEIEPLSGDIRDDKIYRFITLVFMDHEHEVELIQLGNDLSVQRRYNEAYA